MADSSKDLQLRELKDMINDLKKMIKTQIVEIHDSDVIFKIQ